MALVRFVFKLNATALFVTIYFENCVLITIKTTSTVQCECDTESYDRLSSSQNCKRQHTTSFTLNIVVNGAAKNRILTMLSMYAVYLTLQSDNGLKQCAERDTLINLLVFLLN